MDREKQLYNLGKHATKRLVHIAGHAKTKLWTAYYGTALHFNQYAS